MNRELAEAWNAYDDSAAEFLERRRELVKAEREGRRDMALALEVEAREAERVRDERRAVVVERIGGER